MKLTVNQATPYNAATVSLRCPHCSKEAAFAPVPGAGDVDVGAGIRCGQRQCPSHDCKGHIFVVTQMGRLLQSYPPTRIDFRSDEIPVNVVRSFEEAITAHSNECYMASALMVRRTLEEVCVDKGAGGKDLKQRIGNLKGKIVIPDELFAAMDELRLLGNDAAHIEARAYDKITEEEMSVAIEFTKELLKALYQYSGLLSKLRGLRKDT